MTMFASFSLTLPLLRFFFFDLPPAMAAFIFASFDFCTTLLAPMAQVAVWARAHTGAKSAGACSGRSHGGQQGGAEVEGGEDEGCHGWRQVEEEEVEQGQGQGEAREHGHVRQGHLRQDDEGDPQGEAHHALRSRRALEGQRLGGASGHPPPR